jgi:hypothetical protein
MRDRTALPEESATVLRFRTARFRRPVARLTVVEPQRETETSALPDNVIPLALARSLRRARPRFGPPEGEAA